MLCDFSVIRKEFQAAIEHGKKALEYSYKQDQPSNKYDPYLCLLTVYHETEDFDSVYWVKTGAYEQALDYSKMAMSV